MKVERVYNLYKFALMEIFRPYQTMILEQEKRLMKLPCKLDDVVNWLRNDLEWRGSVIDRISLIPFAFPTYMKHSLVDYLLECPEIDYKESDDWINIIPASKSHETKE